MEILSRLMQIIKLESIHYTELGLQTLIFAAEGDMRQVINNLQATYISEQIIDEESVCKICDLPDLK